MNESVGSTPPLKDETQDNSRWVLVVLAVVLIGSFLWRAIVPAHEVPETATRNLTIGLDLLCLVSLIGLYIQIHRKRSPTAGWFHMLFGIALLAGLGLFAIRLGGNESRLTGHIKYELIPRSDGHENQVVDIHGKPVIPATNAPAHDTTPAEPGSPSAAYKVFFTAYNNKDIATLKTLIAKDAGIYGTFDGKKADEMVDERLRKMVENKVRPSDATRNEKITGETATVECVSPKGNWYTVEFVKEGGQWKLKSF